MFYSAAPSSPSTLTRPLQVVMDPQQFLQSPRVGNRLSFDGYEQMLHVFARTLPPTRNVFRLSQLLPTWSSSQQSLASSKWDLVPLPCLHDRICPFWHCLPEA